MNVSLHLNALLQHELLLPVLRHQTVQGRLQPLYLRDHLNTGHSQVGSLASPSFTSDLWISFSFFCISKSEVLRSISFVLEISRLNWADRAPNYYNMEVSCCSSLIRLF